MNDYSAHDLVARFIGYGGAFYHHRVADVCQYYIKCSSMRALLPLSLTRDEYESLDKVWREFYEQGLAEIESDQVIINYQ